jgi:hypothetical protein
MPSGAQRSVEAADASAGGKPTLERLEDRHAKCVSARRQETGNA